MGLKRATVIAKMRGAFKSGQSASSFFNEMRLQGLTYRNQTMQSDWRSVNELTKKEGAMQYVRKGYYPTGSAMAVVDWEFDKEYMYVVKVWSRLHPGEPLTERKVNIVTAAPMTPEMVAQAIVEKWAEWEDYTAETIEEIVPWSAIRTTYKK